MLDIRSWDSVFEKEETQTVLRLLYGKADSSLYSRFNRLLDGFKANFSSEPVHLFSAPGRTEIGGNHTDHQHGCVVAGSVDLDVIAAVRPNGTGIIRVLSEGYEMDVVNTAELCPVDIEKNHSTSIIRGTAARFLQLGYKIGGFDAYTTSNVLKGSGLSSSAAFEVLIGTILNHVYNCGAISPIAIAQIGQYAENVFFGKPSGLMDQMASSVGSAVFIDFKQDTNPIVEKLDFDFSRFGHALCIIDTGADHADLTDQYASIPSEMNAVSEYLGKSVLRECDEADFLSNLKGLREKCGDRAVLRAFHYFEENKRAIQMASAIREGNFELFLSIVRESGLSSYMYLQNVVPLGNTLRQEVAVSLALCDGILGKKGAFRVHGGGFAGTIQAFVPQDMLAAFKSKIEAVLGAGSCYVLSIRPLGGTLIASDKKQQCT
ncbi:MAG: galactokinase family protein [Oscillospiraceae bacterium]